MSQVSTFNIDEMKILVKEFQNEELRRDLKKAEKAAKAAEDGGSKGEENKL
jgi:hypothetical protein